MSFRISKSIFGEGLEKAMARPDGARCVQKNSIGKKRTQTRKTLITVRLSAETRENFKSFSKDAPKTCNLLGLVRLAVKKGDNGVFKTKPRIEAWCDKRLFEFDVGWGRPSRSALTA